MDGSIKLAIYWNILLKIVKMDVLGTYLHFRKPPNWYTTEITKSTLTTGHVMKQHETCPLCHILHTVLNQPCFANHRVIHSVVVNHFCYVPVPTIL